MNDSDSDPIAAGVFVKIGASSSRCASFGNLPLGFSVGSSLGVFVPSPPGAVGSGDSGSVGSSVGSSVGPGEVGPGEIGAGEAGSDGFTGTSGATGAFSVGPVFALGSSELAHPLVGVHNGDESAADTAAAPRVDGTMRATAARSDAVRRLGALM
ncbi:MAG: hypothetical protein L0I80_10380 [Brevibacterium sp.]|uniref:hypothetical protein n=1 Tax=Brevibacterium sp. TaxID=1701 RepID=UPI00264978F0|nr:hypothetical protein [Brevibacterium sp.]MDN5807720.1 hypothetical protein [Brevibacterium sp.]MDN5834641.1 hypothetical protein [Brevibacterium sp.]MDN5876814.1 hypothetical protein [Brevibacterium sp.]MDN5910343.1 hypothetical protein [Brevibacterium sp.]MDN6124253.1 hypothetical protein [Brevibacterium sp.]